MKEKLYFTIFGSDVKRENIHKLYEKYSEENIYNCEKIEHCDAIAFVNFNEKISYEKYNKPIFSFQISS